MIRQSKDVDELVTGSGSFQKPLIAQEDRLVLVPRDTAEGWRPQMNSRSI